MAQKLAGTGDMLGLSQQAGHSCESTDGQIAPSHLEIRQHCRIKGH